MLTEEVLEKLSERIVERMVGVNKRVLETIGEQIKYIGTLNPTTARNLSNMLKYGADFDSLVQYIAHITDLNVIDIYEIFIEVAKDNYQFAEQFYKYRKKPYIPFEDNWLLQQEVKAIAKATAESYLNISKTFGFRINGQDSLLSVVYQNVIDESIMAISQGQVSYTEAIRKTVKELRRTRFKDNRF